MLAEAEPKPKRIPLWRACCALHGLGWSISDIEALAERGPAACRTVDPQVLPV